MVSVPETFHVHCNWRRSTESPHCGAQSLEKAVQTEEAQLGSQIPTGKGIQGSQIHLGKVVLVLLYGQKQPDTKAV